jgi:hypothetical protein
MYNMHIRQEFSARSDQEANDEVERQGGALPLIEAALSRSSWLNEDDPRRQLEPLVRRQSPPQLIPEPEPRHSMLYE